VNPYVPQRLPLDNLDWVRRLQLISSAHDRLGEYKGIVNAIPNADIFLSPLTLQEAVLSSRIEGTQETLEDVLRFEASATTTPPEKLPGIQEIINYRKAMAFAVEELQSRPINLNMVKKMHAILMDGVRGKDKGRGELRRTQVYIGLRGGGIESASYVPPTPERVLEFLDNWEKYIHFDEKDRLVQLAIIHAQFEIIHPFLDGNGRIGRILIPLFLMEKGLLDRPVFYISAILEANREEYILRLNRITSDSDWDGWIDFFLGAVTAQAEDNIQKSKEVVALYDRLKSDFVGQLSSRHAIRALDSIFKQPIMSVRLFSQISGVPERSALRLLDQLKERGILVVVEGAAGNRGEIMAFSELLTVIG
jgi:Fic family protein